MANEYLCVDEEYYKRVESLEAELQKASTTYQVGEQEFADGNIKQSQLIELEYEMNKAELQLSEYRLKQVAEKQIFF